VDQVKLTVQVEKIRENGQWRLAEGLVLIKTGLYPVFQYGDQLDIKCYLHEPEEINGFAYDRYLAKSGIYSTCYQPMIKILSAGENHRLVRAILVMKNKFREIVERHLVEPQASLVNALILGLRGNIPPELNNQFSVTGITHVIAISGQHITIMAGLLTSLLISLGLRRGQVFWPIVFIICFYIFLVGLPASAVRAGIMALIFLLAARFGRLNNSINGLVFAAGLMLLINPKLLRDDIGFQLSFLAILSLIYLVPFFSEKLEKLPALGPVKEMFIVTISAQILTGPLIMYYFNRLSLIAPLVNILILPIFPPLMILGFLAIGVGFLHHGLAQLLFSPVWLLNSYFIKVVEICAKIPLAAVNIQDFSGWLVAGFYLGFFLVILRPWKIILPKERSSSARTRFLKSAVY
jgi:competence protein ComEC